MKFQTDFDLMQKGAQLLMCGLISEPGLAMLEF
jgi:hypothetical protein